MLANDSSFWQYNTYANICPGSPGMGRQTTLGLSKTAIFSVFAGYFFKYFRDEASVIIWWYAVLVGFSVIPICMTLNGYFALNSVFTPVSLAETVQLQKIISWKLTKIDTHWMTLNGHYTPCFKIHAFSEPNTKIWVKVDLHYQWQRCSTIAFGIFARVSTRGVSDDSGVVDHCFFRCFRVKANMIIVLFTPSSLFYWHQIMWPWMTLPFTLNSVLLCQLKFKICLFTYAENASISILGIDNIFSKGHMYKLELCTKLLNILRLGIFNSFGLLKLI